jgi:hypothetical protein
MSEQKSFNLAEQVWDLSQKILRFDSRSLSKPLFHGEEPSRYFDEIMQQIEELKNIIQNTPSLIKILSSLPEYILKSLCESLKEVQDIFMEMNGHTSNGPRDGQLQEYRNRHDGISKRFKEAYGTIFPLLLQIANLSTFNRLNEHDTQISKLSENFTVQGVAKYKDLFDERAEDHKSSAKFWLICGGASFAISVIYLLCMTHCPIFQNKFSPYDYLNFFAHISVRIFLFSLCGFAIYFCARNYSLNKHQQLVNTDRRTALETYPEFSKAAINDNDLRRLVVWQITNTIFSRPEDGYTKTENDSPNPTSLLTQFSEIVSLGKTATGK